MKIESLADFGILPNFGRFHWWSQEQEWCWVCTKSDCHRVNRVWDWLSRYLLWKCLKLDYKFTILSCVKLVITKGQLISKTNSTVFIWTKKRTIFFSISALKIYCFVGSSPTQGSMFFFWNLMSYISCISKVDWMKCSLPFYLN